MTINVDGAGYVLGTNSITALSAKDGFEQEVEALIRPYPGMVWVDPWPQSNHSTFAMRGVPSLAISSTGAWEIAHTHQQSMEICFKWRKDGIYNSEVVDYYLGNRLETEVKVLATA